MIAPLLTPAARRHAATMTRAIATSAAHLDRDFLALLKQRAYDDAQIRAFLAITPSAASQLRSYAKFLEQVDYNGRRLAKLNVPPTEVNDVLLEFGAILDPILGGRFQPAREQLHLATVLALEKAFYGVREVETQAFFGLCQAEVDAKSLDDLMQRFAAILTQTFHARAGRL